MGTNVTDDELKELEALERAATPGPWLDQHTSIDQHWEKGGAPVIESVTYNRGYESYDRLEWKEVDRALIVAARNALPRLIEEIRRLKEIEFRYESVSK